MLVEANGIKINCLVEGRDSAPWLVFSNSLATNFSMWDEQAAALLKSYRVLRYDQRGHGGTQATDGPYNLDMLTDDLAALLGRLSVTSARIIGISMGGVTALSLAARYPQLVERVVACDCNGFSAEASGKQWAGRIALAKREGMEPLVEATISRWFPPEFVARNPPVLDKVRTMIRSTPVAGFAGCAGALAQLDVRPQLAAISCPARFIGGSLDPSFNGLKQLHAMLPGSAIVEIGGAGHLSNLEKPGEFMSALEKLLMN